MKRDTSAQNIIDETTLAVVLTRDAFYFGTAKSFTDDYRNIRDKFYIKHMNNAPQRCSKTIITWAKANQYNFGKKVILVPTDEIPMVLIQVMASLRKDDQFKEIVRQWTYIMEKIIQ